MSELGAEAAAAETPPTITVEFAEVMKRASEHIDKGEPKIAFDLCMTLLQGAEMSWSEALKISGLMTRMRQDELAADIQSRVFATIEAQLRDRPEDALVHQKAGYAYEVMGRRDEALALLSRSFELDPKNTRVGLRVSMMVLEGTDDPAAALAPWEPALATLKRPDSQLLLLCQMFTAFGYRDTALALLARAEPLVSSFTRATYDIIHAALHSLDISTDQHSSAVSLFDNFSGNYDDVLEGLGNNGPQMTAAALAALDLAQDGARNVLDAGCGTGLCAPFLAPYAKTLHGCDISVGMLKKAQEKAGYTYLTRTDLSDITTYPDGPFDLVVSNDTFVYFGALDTAFAAVSEVMAPGGWFVFTVEEGIGIDEARGYQITPSGRFAHAPSYVAAALAGAGFDAPSVMQRDVLRSEFTQPVKGLGVAVQKLG